MGSQRVGSGLGGFTDQLGMEPGPEDGEEKEACSRYWEEQTQSQGQECTRGDWRLHGRAGVTGKLI